MTVTRYYSNVAIAGTIGNPGGISAGATSMYLTTTPSGYPNQYPFTLRLEPGTASEELVSVTAGSGTSGTPWTITRGYDGTTARSHAQSVAVQHGMSASDVATSRTHESLGSGSGVHGLPTAAWAAASFAVINETVLSNSTTTLITWSSIPQTYAHLLIVVQARSTSTASQRTEVQATINGDSASKYSYIDLATDTFGGSLSGASNNTGFAQSQWSNFIQIAASQAGSSVNAGGGFAILPNYAGSSYNKAAYAVSGMGNGTGSAASLRVRACYYNPASQLGITSIGLAVGAGNYLTGSFFGLYAFGA